MKKSQAIVNSEGTVLIRSPIIRKESDKKQFLKKHDIKVSYSSDSLKNGFSRKVYSRRRPKTDKKITSTPVKYLDYETPELSEFPVTNFLSLYKNDKTQTNYRIAITRFLDYSMPSETSNHCFDLDVLAKKYLKYAARRETDPYFDLREFGTYLSSRYAPTTVSLYVRCVIVWLEDNGHEFNRRKKQKIRAQLPPPRPREERVELKRKTFRALYFNLPDDVSVLLLVLLASGMRIGEALQLKRQDLDWTQERIAIHIPAEITKTKTNRVTYLTEEAAVALRYYLRKRRDNDEELFKITYAQAQASLRKASIDIGCSVNISGRYTGIHWHMTRKWFLSRFSLVASRDIAEHLAGHEGYLSRSYRRYTNKQILKSYKMAEDKLRILQKRIRIKPNGPGGI